MTVMKRFPAAGLAPPLQGLPAYSRVPSPARRPSQALPDHAVQGEPCQPEVRIGGERRCELPRR